MSPLRTLTLGLVLAVSACDLEFPEQEIYFRHDVAGDRLDVLFIVKGLSAGQQGPDELGKAERAVRRLLDGEREFMILDWPWYVHFEEMVRDARAAEGDAAADARRLLAVEDRVQVTRAGLFRDAEGRLCGFQLVQIRELTRFQGWLNDAISRTVTAGLAAGDFAGEEGLDAETLRRWGEKAVAGTPWVAFQDGDLVVDVPFSEEAMSRNLAWLLDETMAVEPNDRWALIAGRELVRHTRTARFGDGGLHLTFGSTSGTLALWPDAPGREYRPALAERLADQGVAIDGQLTLEEVRKLLPWS